MDDFFYVDNRKTINYYGESGRDCLNNNCQMCNFVREVMKINIAIVKNFLSYKKLMKKSYYYIHLKRYSFHNVLKMKNFNYSVHLMNSEGPGRIRNKLKYKLDILKNEELNKSYYEDLDKGMVEELSQKNSLSKFNRSFENNQICDILENVFYTDQIFNLNLIRNFIDRDEIFVGTSNCLFIKNLSQIDCIIVLTVKNIYILKNVHIDQESNLLLSKYKFKKYYWSINDYKEEFKRACPFLNNFTLDGLNNDSEEEISDMKLDSLREYSKNNSHRKRISDYLKMNKFFRDRSEFEIIKFEYKEINEIHKKRYLLKQNSLEFFLKNGKNFFIAFNLDKRELIFQTVILFILFRSLNTQSRIQRLQDIIIQIL